MVGDLLQMSRYGDTDAVSLKNGIDSIFKPKGPLPCEDYNVKLVALTSDGASVNTGQITGLMTRIANEGREWLLKIHCVNYRVELAVKMSSMRQYLPRSTPYIIASSNYVKILGQSNLTLRKAPRFLT